MFSLEAIAMYFKSYHKTDRATNNFVSPSIIFNID